MTKRLLSGIQPSGPLHLGNYLGAVKPWTELQNDYDAFIMLATYHALTTKPEPAVLREQTLDLTAMLVACGIDPKITALFLQLPEHVELAGILGNFVGLGALDRMTQFKEKSSRHGQNAGLYTYPILQAADILTYEPDVVPVGEDQAQHLELTRDVAQAVNSHAGKKVLVEPKTLLSKAPRVMALNDPTKKMSKSIPGSAIGLLDDEAAIERTIKRAVTDSDPNSSAISSALKNLFVILAGVSSAETVEHFEKLRQDGKLRYSDLKEALIEDTIHLLKPIQAAYQSLRADEPNLLKVLDAGRCVAQPIAIATLKKVKDALGLITN
ncbi:MAG TPA: tryptophan--tRNA ligase [Candidatus Saccharimonadales bacterium]|nr:tryptophan--tRNA ligase [Candidatus Saccharimonadales bacterium]